MQSDTDPLRIFTLVYNREKKKIYSYLLRMTGDKMNAEDLTQEVFFGFYRNMAAIADPDKYTFYLFRSARNALYAFLRQKKIRIDQYEIPEEEDALPSETVEQEQEAMRLEFIDALHQQLELVSPAMREIFLLKEFGGLRYDEIAKLQGTDSDLVKSRLFRIRSFLKKRLKHYL